MIDWFSTITPLGFGRDCVIGKTLQRPSVERSEGVFFSLVESIGTYIIDGKDDPLWLEIDWIRAYREEE